MKSLLIVVAGVLWACWRYGRRIAPAAKKVLSWGDDLGGLTMFFAFGGAAATGRFVSRGARAALWAAFAVAALLNGTVRLLFLVAVGWALWRRSKGRRVEAAEFARSGFATRAERKLIHEATTAAMLSMNLGKITRTGEQIPPALSRWRKLPVKIGDKTFVGQFRYVCRVAPAPGQGIASITSKVARGLDGNEDHLRDAVAGTLRVASGREAAAVRKAGLVPGIVLTTAVPVANRSGEMIGQVELSLWTTDPFRQPVVPYPYDGSKPIVKRIGDPVPVGLLRSNFEAKIELNLSTGIMGSSGSGKSSVVRPALIAAAHLDVIIICISLKGPRDYALLRDRFAGGVIITDPAVAANVLRWVEREVRRRNELSPAELAKLPDIILIADEAQELRAEIVLMIPNAKLGRSARVWSWPVTQYAPASVKPEDGGFPTLLGRELGQRMSGRIEGGFAQAEVAVGQRVSKSAGPHLIPPGKQWAGVLFDNHGRYIRAYWIDPEDAKGPMGICAASCGPRPADPPGFVEALTSTPVRPQTSTPAASATAAPAWPEDGAKRGVDGTAVSLTFAEIPEDVLDALATLRIKPQGTQRFVTVKHLTQRLAAVSGDDDDELLAAATVEAFIDRPRIPTFTTITNESE